MTRKLGTFYGVYSPTVLTILGVIMYLRFGWLVGHLGLVKVLPLVLLANVITLITTLSFSAVASNTQIGAGGAYYVISRSLGIEIGGAIGLPLYLSQAFSVTLYAYGLAESLRFVWPGLPLQPVHPEQELNAILPTERMLPDWQLDNPLKPRRILPLRQPR